MTLIRRICGVLLIAVGVVWFFQGVGDIKGSFMTGETQWSVIGAIAGVVGLLLLFWPRKKTAAGTEDGSSTPD